MGDPASRASRAKTKLWLNTCRRENRFAHANYHLAIAGPVALSQRMIRQNRPFSPDMTRYDPISLDFPANCHAFGPKSLERFAKRFDLIAKLNDHGLLVSNNHERSAIVENRSLFGSSRSQIWPFRIAIVHKRMHIVLNRAKSCVIVP
ncbi:hypothetical protein [Massilia sp. TSP1-1-2]|uniref:hypothetical protein n=1 Tax=Massilia sp. TSP1-1-2 TaxID=2804649 RepID=UPI003CE946B7